MKAKNVTWNLSETGVQIEFSAFDEQGNHFRDIQLTFNIEDVPETNPERFLIARVQQELVRLQGEKQRLEQRRSRAAKVKETLAVSGLNEVNLPQIPAKPAVQVRSAKGITVVNLGQSDAYLLRIDVLNANGDTIQSLTTEDKQVQFQLDAGSYTVNVTPVNAIGQEGPVATAKVTVRTAQATG